jgi:hypothetical protein
MLMKTKININAKGQRKKREVVLISLGKKTIVTFNIIISFFIYLF